MHCLPFALELSTRAGLVREFFMGLNHSSTTIAAASEAVVATTATAAEGASYLETAATTM